MKLPKGWKIGKVGCLFDVQLGKMLNETARTTGEQQPYLTNCNVQWGRFDLSKLNEMHFSERDKSKFTLKKGDLVVCEGGEVGRCAIWREEISPCFFQKTLHRLRPTTDEIVTEFMFAYMSYISGSKRVSDLTTQSSIAHLTREQFCKLDVILPPLPEQRKIAEILGAWDEALEKLDALIAAKELRKKGLMQQLLTGKRRIPAFAKSVWKRVKMGDVMTRVFRPIDWKADLRLSLVSLRRRCGGLFRREGVLGAEYKTHDLHELKTNDFLVSMRQVVHGAWALVTPEFEGSHVSKEYAIFVNASPEKLHMSYFAWLAQTPRMIRLARVASTGVHIEKLIFDPEFFLRESIRIPSDIDEQRTIADILDACDDELRLLRDQRASIDRQKRGLMQRLLTGRVSVSIEERKLHA